MHQRGKTVTRSDGGTSIVLDRQHQHNNIDCARFGEWIDPSSDATDIEVSHLVIDPPSTKNLKHNRKRCCRTSTSSGYSSQSPPPSGGSCYVACCPNTVISRSSFLHPHHHHHHHSTNRISVGVSNHQTIGSQSLAVIHETDTIPRPIWPFMADDYTDIRAPAYAEMIDGAAVLTAARRSDEKTQRENSCCDYCRACCSSSHVYRRDSSIDTTTASSAREVLLELSRTLNSVIEADGDLTAEEILRDISLTVARGIINNNEPKDDNPTSDVLCDDYTYRLSSSSSSGGGKESSVGVNPVNLRVYGKPKWLHVPASSRSSSHCPYEGKTLLNSAQSASRTLPAFGDANANQAKSKIHNVTPAVFLVPQRHLNYHNTYRNNDSKLMDCKGRREDNPAGHFESGVERKTTIERLNPRGNDNCTEKCNSGEPVYSTQLDGSDESSSYGAIGDSQSAKKTGWNDSAKVFDRHLDFTLDGNRAERLGRAIAKAKRRRQWCRGITAILGLVFFVLSVVIVSLSVTRGRKVFGSM